MFGLAALVLFIIAAIGAFAKVGTTLDIIGLACVGLACLSLAVAWPAITTWRRTP